MSAIVAEPASAALRRLHEEATPGPWLIEKRPGVTIHAVLNGLPREVVSISGQAAGFDLRAEPPEIMAANGRAVATLRNAADALADLRDVGRGPGLRVLPLATDARARREAGHLRSLRG